MDHRLRGIAVGHLLMEVITISGLRMILDANPVAGVPSLRLLTLSWKEVLPVMSPVAPVTYSTR